MILKIPAEGNVCKKSVMIIDVTLAMLVNLLCTIKLLFKDETLLLAWSKF